MGRCTPRRRLAAAARRSGRRRASSSLLGDRWLLSRAAPAAAAAPAATPTTPARSPCRRPAPAPGATVTVSRTDGPGQPDRRWSPGPASGRARPPGWPTPATRSTSTPRTRCASTSAAAPTRRAPATATARPASAASRRPTTTPAVPPVPAFTYPGQTGRVRRDAGRPGQLAGQRDAAPTAPVRSRSSSSPSGSRPASAATRNAPCSLVVVPNYGRPQGATEDLMDAPWAWDRRTVVPLQFLPVERRLPAHRAPRSGSRAARWPPTPWRAGARKTCTLADGRRSPSTTPPSVSRRPAATSASGTTRRRPGHRPARQADAAEPRRRLRAGLRSPAWSSRSRSTTPTASRSLDLQAQRPAGRQADHRRRTAPAATRP